MTLRILMIAALTVLAYLLLLHLAAHVGDTMPAWQRLLLVVAAVTAFVGAFRALGLLFESVAR